MDTATRIQLLDKAICISHSANTPGKGINPTILPSAMDKWLDRLSSLTLVWQLAKEKQISELRPVKLVKSYLVSHLARAEGLVNIRVSLNKFPDFFRMGTFIDSTHMKL